MDINEAILLLESKRVRKVEGTYKGYKMVAYTIRYKNQTIFRIDIHYTYQKTLDSLAAQGERDLGT